MADPITKTQRWLDLIAFLVGRRLPVSVDRIMEGVPAYAATANPDSARRMFERDKDELREIGIPLETIPYSISFGEETREGYRLTRQDFYLPYLRLLADEAGGIRPAAGDRPHQESVPELELTADEAGAALDALLRVSDLPSFPYAPEARSAFLKLSGDFDLESFRRTPVIHAEPPSPADLRPALRTLAEALRSSKRVAFSYHGIHRDEVTERDVAPYGLVFQGGHWYLVGQDALRDDVRMLRVSRMRDLAPNTARPHTPDYEIPDDFRLEELVGREAWELGSEGEGEVEAHVRFGFPLSLWAARNHHGELVEEGTDGAAVRRFRVRQVHPFLRWVLSFEGDAAILEPRELREAVVRMALAIADRHGFDDERDPGSREPPDG